MSWVRPCSRARGPQRLPGDLLLLALVVFAPALLIACADPQPDGAPEPAAAETAAQEPGGSPAAAPGASAESSAAESSETPAMSAPIFEEVTAATGLDFVQFNGMAGRFYYSEMMGSGGALFDFDGDGDLDLYLVQGAELGGVAAADTVFPPPENMLPLRDQLYRNDPGSAGMPRFTDVTAESGIDAQGYGMGAVAADFDGDGHVDLYVTNAGANQHWRNLGDGTFEDVTDEVSAVPGWSVPAVPGDFDGDGDLDLFVGNYVRYDTDLDKTCTDELGQRNYCGPLSYPPGVDTLLLNRGDGTFVDVTHGAGIDQAFGAALGAVAFDFDGDHRLDLYVANDGEENQLWRNLGPGPEADAVPRFENLALLTGVAVNGLGQAEASMGVDVADPDDDGDWDLVLTHLTKETNTLYLAESGGFTDRSAESGIGAPSFDRTGFGVHFLDWDLDGDLDLPVVNGAVKLIKDQALAGDPYPLHQPNQLFRSLRADTGSVRWEEVDGAQFTAYSEVSRGLLAGDLDQDGDPDLIVTQNAGPARVYRNVAGDGAAWLGVDLRDARGRIAHYAIAELAAPGGETLRRRVAVAAGYASSQDPRILFGLGRSPATSERSHTVRVEWPDGAAESFGGLAQGRYHVLRRGSGQR